ncbi:uncharacterized protein LOC120270907 [Dioscorea cayenensis subsp. rotundata]|uniref:Uncharacterized protein LOC120270907 n=1 Tax=Dioscorea cayennensis subsp. rotundata TaxID=55577 RepID=A0AB40C2B7_DIOCR|nr:uncharacterized protein LOC120270907 [Dioscorea cayenensis subsp. rotundata]
MPATDYQGSSSPFASIGRSILSIRRDQVHSMDSHHEHGSSQEKELDGFQRHAADLLLDLAGGGGGGEELLSLPWIRKLLNVFVICQEEFRVILFNNRACVSRAPVDRLISEFFERNVKALDVCNAIRDGIEQVRQWHKHLEIVTVALDPSLRTIGEGQLRRAKKALADLAVGMLEEKDVAGSALAHRNRNRSFGRSNHASSSRDHHRHPGGHFRSLSWSVSRSWSAARQLQAIGNNLSAPRGHEIVASNGLAVPVFTMSSVLLFVMWALVAAIPCQDRGLQTHFSFSRSFSWASPILSMHERIMEESKKRERKNSNGLLKEIHQIEKCARQLSELMDAAHFPLPVNKEMEIRQVTQELTQIVNTMREELDLLERQVREVFHRIIRSRTEGLDCLSHHPE